MPAPQEAEPGKGGFWQVDPAMGAPSAHVDAWYRWCERVGIAQFDGALSEDEAKALALLEAATSAQKLRTLVIDSRRGCARVPPSTGENHGEHSEDGSDSLSTREP